MGIKNKNTSRILTRIRFILIWQYSLIPLIFVQTSCKKLTEVSAPITSINEANVYATDLTAAAVLTGIYTNISLDDLGFEIHQSGFTTLSLYPSLLADELTLYDLTNPTLSVYYRNALTNSITIDYWKTIYPIIFTANSAIEGLTGSNSITPAVKQQLLGEAKFIRAFCYFYLVNLYGDIPLPTTTNYNANALLSRSPRSKAYDLIITDLQAAQNLLSSNYLGGDALSTSSERVRPNKWAATALLARVYLYSGDYKNADIQASSVINMATLYSLNTLDSVFLKNSNESIWQLQPVGSGTQANTGAARLFILPSTGPTVYNPVYLSNHFLSNFESGDQRKTKWINNVSVGNITYYYPYKYKSGVTASSVNEYTTVLRLGEQYLIRAEAKAQLKDFSGALNDLNTIRTRAGLAKTFNSVKSVIIEAIQHERQLELFTEWGDRWLNMKRVGTINSIMGTITPQKGGVWNTNWQWYPIPLTELKSDPNLQQNAGY
jgi:hypothetical protein